MKLYSPSETPFMVRVNLKKHKCTPEHLAIIEAQSIDYCMKWVKDILLKQNLNPFPEGSHTTVEFREYDNSTNGKTKSFKVYNISPKEIKQIIIDNL